MGFVSTRRRTIWERVIYSDPNPDTFDIFSSSRFRNSLKVAFSIADVHEVPASCDEATGVLR